MESEVWMISNRQPWPEALLRKLISTKTRSRNVYLPPVGATVYLHASKALWSGWQHLPWTYDMNVPNLHRGGVVGVATVAKVGLTNDVMPEEDFEYFFTYMVSAGGSNVKSYAGEKSIVFKDVRRLPFIPCRGAQVPTRVLPQELKEWLRDHGRYQGA